MRSGSSRLSETARTGIAVSFARYTKHRKFFDFEQDSRLVLYRLKYLPPGPMKMLDKERGETGRCYAEETCLDLRLEWLSDINAIDILGITSLLSLSAMSIEYSK